MAQCKKMLQNEKKKKLETKEIPQHIKRLVLKRLIVTNFRFICVLYIKSIVPFD